MTHEMRSYAAERSSFALLKSLITPNFFKVSAGYAKSVLQEFFGHKFFSATTDPQTSVTPRGNSLLRTSNAVH